MRPVTQGQTRVSGVIKIQSGAGGGGIARSQLETVMPSGQMSPGRSNFNVSFQDAHEQHQQ